MKGHIRKRGQRSWAVVVELERDPATGRRRQRWHSVKGTKKDAERRLRELLTSIDQGSYIKPARLTVGEFLNQWLRDYVIHNTTARTAEGYAVIVNRHLRPNLGRIPLPELRPSQVQAYYGRALETLSSRTVLHIHRVLSKALTDAVQWQLLSYNVALAVTPPRAQHPQMDTLSEEELKRFLDETAKTTYYELFFTAAYTGMRRGELLGLQWNDIDLDLAQLSVVRTLQRVTGRGIIIANTKTHGSRRTIALSPSLTIALRELQKRQRYEYSLLGLCWRNDSFVFAHPDGQPLDPSVVSKAFSRLVKRAGLPHVRFHDLRHTHATLMLKQGVHPKVVSERLGHSNISTTLDTYSHVMPGLQEAAAKRFEESLGLQNVCNE